MLTHNIMGPFLLDWCSVEVIILDSPVIEVDVRLLQPFSDFFSFLYPLTWGMTNDHPLVIGT